MREARAAGMTERVLSHHRFVRPFHGVRDVAWLGTPQGRAAGTQPDDALARAATRVRPRIREGEALSHTTALHLWGCPIRTSPAIHLTAPLPHSRSVAHGVVGHTRTTPFPTRAQPGTGAPLIAPWLALCQSGALLPFRELVVAADHLLRDPAARGGPPLASLARLRRAALTERVRGIAAVRIALRVASVGAESRMESLLRLILVRHSLDHHFVLQQSVHAPGGEWIGRFDLVCAARKLLVEYDGDQHRTSRTQYERDLERLDAAREAGFHVLRFRAKHVLLDPVGTAARVADALGVSPSPVRGKLGELLAEDGVTG